MRHRSLSYSTKRGVSVKGFLSFLVALLIFLPWDHGIMELWNYNYNSMIP